MDQNMHTLEPLIPGNVDSQNVFHSLALQFRRAKGHKDRKFFLRVVKGIRQKLSEGDNPPLDDLFKTGLISDFAKLLDPDDKINIELQHEILWIFTNVCTGDDQQTSRFLTKRLIETLLRFVGHLEQKLVEQTLWTIGNISACDGTIRDTLLQMEALLTITKFIKKSKPCLKQENIARILSWILSNFARARDSHKQLLKYGLIKINQEFLLLNDRDTCSYACWMYAHLTGTGNSSHVEAILTPKFIERMVELLESKDLGILTPAIRTVGSILSSNSSHTTRMYSAGCLDKLEDLIQHKKPNIRKDGLWAISNLVAEPSLFSEVIGRPLFAKVLNLAILDISPNKLEALICFVNALNTADQKQVKSIIDLGFVRVLPHVLSHKNVDLIMTGLEALEIILRRGSEADMPTNPYLLILESEGIIPHLEELQTHVSNQVYSKVARIIDQYFDTE